MKLIDPKGIVVLAAMTCCTPGITGAQNTTSPFRVTIVAVDRFTEKGLHDEDMEQRITSAAQELRDFFINYGAATRLLSKTDTTSIRHWLFDDLSNDTSPIVQLVFVITHGKGKYYLGDTVNKTELFLAASDTDPNDISGTGVRGSEFVDGMGHLTAGSAAFLFIDACQSGSIDSIGLRTRLRSSSSNAPGFVLLVSSMPDEDAYKMRSLERSYNSGQKYLKHAARQKIR